MSDSSRREWRFYLDVMYPTCCRCSRRLKTRRSHETRSVKIVDRVSAVEAIKRLKDHRIYVSTYHTMHNIIRDESQQLSPHFFGFIVADESYRSFTVKTAITSFPIPSKRRSTTFLSTCAVSR